ncbi:serine carboxypeptidase S28 family protein [Striga asiatica]|uniref:Serine carboxypeptidase S28 family protein n=1 Tax=Striga asiatica TaxID=4170 RepID=A0A5A7RCZ4_STRAF|nr:serine carboxypeptidase S28 family protein [Striga asiatica]
MEKAIENDTIRGYFNSAQALADFAEILLHIKKSLSANDSPILVVGGSYGGMLAAWFRLKYPHVTIGALASSAPILYFDNITRQDAYYSIVTKDFKEASENCYLTIKKSWAEIDRVASRHNGLTILSRRFNTCSQLNHSYELTQFLEDMYVSASQYDAPPEYPVSMVCKGIDKTSSKKTDTLGRIFAGIVSFLGNQTCVDTVGHYTKTALDSQLGYAWQSCSEMVMPIGGGANDYLFPVAPFDINEYNEYCKSQYGVSPRPHWITTYYGGQGIKFVLNRFGSNIIFSNGRRDPWSGGGVLEDLSESLVAITTQNGSHCLDLQPATKEDPEWLIAQRKKELEIMNGWLKTYYCDLQHA